MSSEYRVTWEGKVREVYYIEADSKEQARMTWMDGTPDLSESYDGEVTEIEEVEQP